MMLRPTLVKWLERRSIRPIAKRIAQNTARGPSVDNRASHPTAGLTVSPLYHADDINDPDDGDSLEVPHDETGNPYSFSASAAPRHNAYPPEPRSRAANTYSWSSSADMEDDANDTVEHHGRLKRDGKSANATRRVITATRRPNGSPAEPPSTFRHVHAHAAHAPLTSSPREAQLMNRIKDKSYYNDSGHATAAEGASVDSIDASSPMDDVAVSVSDTATTGESSDAYRFLLHHIDAEIAALQRRHASVTTRRQSIQTHQTQRIRELFEVMENPWTLLPTEVQPALPATGLDVYIKEQKIARQHQNLSDTQPEGQDKMYIQALQKNYRALPAGRKRFYEEAAHYNATLRDELKHQLTHGCSRFEAFLDTIKECTMDMAREGQVPPLPTTHAQTRFHATLSAASNHRRAHAAKAVKGGDEVKTTRGRRSQQQVQSTQNSALQEASAADEGEANEVEADAECEDEDEVEAGGGAVKESGRGIGGRSVALGRGRNASKRIKSAAKKVQAKLSAPPARVKSSTRGAKRRQGPQTSAKRPAIAQPSRKGKKHKDAVRSGGNARGGGKQTGARVARGGGVSPSIPLPNLDHLAVKKIHQMVAPPSGAGGAARKAKKMSSPLKPTARSKKK